MSDANDKIILFLKFGSEENIKALYEMRLIYPNTIEYFQNLIDSGVRGDKFEGTIDIKNFKDNHKLKLEITDT